MFTLSHYAKLLKELNMIEQPKLEPFGKLTQFDEEALRKELEEDKKGRAEYERSK